MKTKVVVGIGIGILGVLVVSSFFIKKNVSSAPAGSMIDKYIKKHPESEDKATANHKVPLFYYIFSKKF